MCRLDQAEKRAPLLLTSTIIGREMLRLLAQRQGREKASGEMEESSSCAWITEGDLQDSIDGFSRRILVPMVGRIEEHMKRRGGTGRLGQADLFLMPDVDNGVEDYYGINLRTILYPSERGSTHKHTFLRFDYAYEKGQR